MRAYHGTTVLDIKTLKPMQRPYSNLEEPCVYLTLNKALAALYIWDKPYMFMTFRFSEDGTPIYYETFPDALRFFYDGVKGCIHTCEGDFDYEDKVGIRPAVISKRPVDSIHCEKVDNAYHKLIELEKEGSLIIERYETRSGDDYAGDREMVLSAIKRMNLLKEEHPMAPFVKETFQACWKEALESVTKK